MFGERLVKLRKSNHLTQEQLSGYLYVTRNAIWSWETGRTEPNIPMLIDIAKFFGVTVGQLIGSEALKI